MEHIKKSDCGAWSPEPGEEEGHCAAAKARSNCKVGKVCPWLGMIIDAPDSELKGRNARRK